MFSSPPIYIFVTDFTRATPGAVFNPALFIAFVEESKRYPCNADGKNRQRPKGATGTFRLTILHTSRETLVPRWSVVLMEESNMRELSLCAAV
jgi:hypothetical protein